MQTNLSNIIESENYWICGNILIFKPQFNNLANIQIQLDETFTEIIFSNYSNVKFVLGTNNTYQYKYHNFWSGSNFSQSIEHLLLGAKNLKKLIFGYKFDCFLNSSLDPLANLQLLKFGLEYNKPLGNSLVNLVNLVTLEFGAYFNKPLDNSLNNLINLKNLKFGVGFDQDISNSLDNLINLKNLGFGFHFNHSISIELDKLFNLEKLSLDFYFTQQTIIPPNVKYLELNCNNEFIMNNLSEPIKELSFGCLFNLPLDNLPNNIEKILFPIEVTRCYFNHELNCLPDSVEIIQLHKNYNKKISKFPKNLKKIICSVYYPYITDFANCKTNGLCLELYFLCKS